MSHARPIVIGTREVWGNESPFGFAHEDRRHHVYVIGMTGVGKSVLLQNMIIQDIEDGQGVGVLDPHGSLASSLLDCIPPRRIDDVVYFNPADENYPVGFNPLRSKERPHLVASGIVGAFKSIWRDSWGPRLEYILYATVAALLESDGVTLLGVQRMLADARYRAWVVKQVKDPMVRSFWVNEFETYDRAFLREAVSPIQNKVGQLLMSPQARNILGQVRSKIDARFMMDDELVVVEGFTATWWLMQMGFPHVVGLMGWTCSEDQASVIADLVPQTGRVWIIADGNENGTRCAASVFEHIAPRISVQWLKLDERKQPTDYPGAFFRKRLGK